MSLVLNRVGLDDYNFDDGAGWETTEVNFLAWGEYWQRR